MDAFVPPAELNSGVAAPVLRRPLGVSALARSALVALLFALFVRAFLLEVVSIPSASMAPTLLPGDQVLVNRFLFTGADFGLLPRRSVERGDIVLFRPPFDPRQEFVKRCVGLAGDWEGGAPVPPGTIWVEGDARAVSLDSRRFGAVPMAALEGRILAVVWSRAASPGAPRRILRQVR